MRPGPTKVLLMPWPQLIGGQADSKAKRGGGTERKTDGSKRRLQRERKGRIRQRQTKQEESLEAARRPDFYCLVLCPSTGLSYCSSRFFSLSSCSALFSLVPLFCRLPPLPLPATHHRPFLCCIWIGFHMEPFVEGVRDAFAAGLKCRGHNNDNLARLARLEPGYVLATCSQDQLQTVVASARPGCSSQLVHSQSWSKRVGQTGEAGEWSNSKPCFFI